MTAPSVVNGRTLLVALLAATTLVVGACSSDDDSASEATTTAAPSSTTIGDSSGAAASTSVADATTDSAAETVETVAPEGDDTAKSPTSLLPAKSGVPENPANNSKGEPITLDETALLACAQNQFAWVELKQGATKAASTSLAVAAERAGASAVPEIKQSAATLRTAASSGSPGTEVDRFLALCVDRGFEY